MEQWDDQAIVLSARSHGESGAIVKVLAESHGQHAGYVRGGKSSGMRAVLEPGTLVSARWQARTADNLGNFSLEPEQAYGTTLMGDSVKLSALLSACSLCRDALAERESHPGIYHGLISLFDAMTTEVWAAAYVIWELALMKELGFGVDLSRCAGGGDAGTLCYVSPRSGVAVSRAEAEPYKEKLLPLPGFLRPERGDMEENDILDGLKLTRYFLETRVFAHHSRGIPEERLRFEERFAKTVSHHETDTDGSAKNVRAQGKEPD